MKKMFACGTVVFALSAMPLLAQQPAGSAGASQPAAKSQAGGSTDSTKSADAATTNPDHQFVMNAASGGMAEVELGQLASDKASSPAVKQFGQRMVADHGKANDELKSLARNKNVTLPTDISAKDKATKDRLSKLSGAAFDRAYMQDMVTDHRQDLSEFRKEAQSGKDLDIKAWAARTLPTLEEHARLAQEASKGAVGTSGTTPSPDGSKSGGAPAAPGTPRTPSTPDTSSTPR